MLKSEDVKKAGFVPLRRAPSEPLSLPSKANPIISRNLSFINQEGVYEDTTDILEKSPWIKLEKIRRANSFRSTSFVGQPTRSRSGTIISISGEPKAIAIVDPFSTGAHLAKDAIKLGYKCVRILSIRDSPIAGLIQEGTTVDFDATLQFMDNLDDEAAIKNLISDLEALPFEILAIIPGAETGVELADNLSFRMSLRTNGIEKSLGRRNKYVMGEIVRNAGIRAAIQQKCSSIEEVRMFMMSLKSNSTKCVAKPIQSAGSDCVYLCRNMEEAEVAFKRIYHNINGLGLLNEFVLFQEYLEGIEYVIDQVSRDGIHKISAIWEYDKRLINGAAFVYFGDKLLPSTLPHCQEMRQYANKVLDALGIVNGASHMEIKYNPETGPCLVEVGARCQGGEGTWIPVAKECIGYTQVDLTLDVYLDGSLFDSINSDKYDLLKFGRNVDFVSRCGGIVRSFPGDPLVRNLPSFRNISWEIKSGDYQNLTIDCFTRPGCAQLVHEDEKQLDKDFEYIHSIETNGLLDYAIITPTPPQQGIVVVVDPFSTGQNIGSTIMKMGYRLVIILSEFDSPVAGLVSKSSKISPMLLIQHDSASADEDLALKKTLDILWSQKDPILAIIPGAETGVELADKLAARFGTRNNGEALTEARRNKYIMQETIRKAGIRSVGQRLCVSDIEVRDFYESLPGSNPFCVVKPNMSAGTDSVNLCKDLTSAITAFNMINGHSNGLGHKNDGALCQEFLSGTEYVIDGVSRDGVYKVVAIWKYDKRSINGANFVYFGMRLRSGEGKVEQELIKYAARVVEALNILQGPSHMEVMYNPETGPCLVEVGARCHGGEGSWLTVAQECIGYTQLDATLNCYLRPDQFDLLPLYPKLQKEGGEVFLVSLYNGTVKDLPGLEEIRNLASFRKLEMFIQPGSVITPTIDCFTRPGSIQLVNENEKDLELDFATIRQLEIEGLFEFF